MSIDISGVDLCINILGAYAVYEAAINHMGGDKAALPAVGLPIPDNLGDVHAIMMRAYARMTEAERAADYWQACADLAAIPRSGNTRN